jgi:hypothetical protein
MYPEPETSRAEALRRVESISATLLKSILLTASLFDGNFALCFNFDDDWRGQAT